jgi:hypothetical protein
LRAYIGALRTRQATPKDRPKALTSRNYNNFTKVNPFCTRRRGVVQLGGDNLQWSGSLIPLEASPDAIFTMAPITPMKGKRPCYANFRLLQLPRHRWVRRP